MTRINVGIPPVELSREHLIAEHREIKRIPNCIKKGRYSLQGIPPKFKLGTGHVKFFYNKLKFLKRRYDSIYIECITRGYDVTSYHDCFNDLPDELYNDYIPTNHDIELIKNRIKEKTKIK